MPVSIFVGTLTTYFRDALRAAGGGSEPVPSLGQVRERILSWRDWISEGLVRDGHLARALDWPEDAAAAPLLGRPGSDCLRALKLLLVYEDGGQCSVAPPARLPARPELDARWVAASEAKFAQSPWDHVLVPELWLPTRFDFTFVCPYPDGHEVQAGSVVVLHEQLAELAVRVFRCSTDELGGGASAQLPADADLRTMARFAARERSLPMLLHH
jgi:hypothetical protein